jgi:hypothetical protein
MTRDNLKHTPGAACASKQETAMREMSGIGCRYATILLAGVIVAALSAAPPPPRQSNPATLPARDAHQGLLIAADPYTDEARSKAKFGKKHPQEAGILALEVYFRNDTDEPIKVNVERIRLMLSVPGYERQRLQALSLEEAAERIVNKKGPNVGVRRLPVPGGGGVVGSSKEVRKMEETLKPLVLASDIVPPHGDMHGFLLFDLAHHLDWVEHATLYVPELSFVASRKELLFFEVDLSRTSPR